MIGLFYINFKSSLCSHYFYGFNGKEKDDEHTQGKYDFGARIYDSRLGRWLAVDPLVKDYPSFSPYSYAGNSTIAFYDPDGKKIVIHYVDADGNQQKFVYKPKAEVPNNKFVQDAVNQLNTLREESKKSKRLIKEAIKSKNVANIHQTTGSNYTEVKGIDGKVESIPNNNDIFSNASNGKGTDVDIYFNPNAMYGAVDESGSLKRPSRVGLLEEIYHANRVMQGEASVVEKQFELDGTTYEYLDLNHSKEEKMAGNFVNYHRAVIDPTGDNLGIVENYRNSDGVQAEIVGKSFADKKKYYDTKDVKKSAKKQGLEIRNKNSKISKKNPDGSKN